MSFESMTFKSSIKYVDHIFFFSNKRDSFSSVISQRMDLNLGPYRRFNNEQRLHNFWLNFDLFKAQYNFYNK